MSSQTVSEAEIQQVLTDLRWLDRCQCAQLPTSAYFVTAGQVISPEALNIARGCPARRQEVIFAYGRRIRSGYIGGLSAGQRASMTLEQALEYIANDPPQQVEPDTTDAVGVADQQMAAAGA